MQAQMVDYRKFRLNKLNTPEFSHLKYLFFWVFFGLAFMCTERVWIRDSYFPIYSSLDSYIPFCEYFLIPYMFWFVYMVGIHAYTLFFDTNGFKKLMQYIMITYTVTLVIYILFPNCQELRPTDFERDNFLTRFMQSFYKFDTNTNVCPSMHVIGSIAVLACSWNSRHFSSTPWRIAFSVTTFLISISTVFLKQHSIIDVVAAIPICIVAYIIVYRPIRKRGRAKK